MQNMCAAIPFLVLKTLLQIKTCVFHLHIFDVLHLYLDLYRTYIGPILSSTGLVSDLYWSCIGPILACGGPLLDLNWTYTRAELDQYLSSIGPVLYLCWRVLHPYWTCTPPVSSSCQNNAARPVSSQDHPQLSPGSRSNRKSWPPSHPS